MTVRDPPAIRYIKLGVGGCWEEASLNRGEIHLGFSDVPHDIAQTGDAARIIAHLRTHGRNPRAAVEDAREVVDFYSLDERCLWITFARGHMWWARAHQKVHWIGTADKTHGTRVRKTIGHWSNLDERGHPLEIGALSSRLTQLASYRRTICKVSEWEYLLTRLAGLEAPAVTKAKAAQCVLVNAIHEAIRLLHWSDFEQLVDLIFLRSGWERVSRLGGNQKIIDLELREPILGTRACAQIKSRASQSILDEYVRHFDTMKIWSCLFFVCHEQQGPMSIHHRDDVHVWTGRALAETVVRSGLNDWLLTKLV